MGGGRAVAGWPTRGQVACLVCVSVPECHQIDARPARGRAGAGWPTRGQVACLVCVLVPGVVACPPVGRWPCWWACRCPCAPRSTHGPPVGVRGAGGPGPEPVACLVCVSGSGGRCRGQGAYLVAVLVLAGLPVGPCACWVPVGVRPPPSQWPAWWVCHVRVGCQSATKSNTRPVAVLWLALVPVGR